MKGGYWVIRTIRSGNVIEKSMFPYEGSGRPRRMRRRGSTTQQKKDSNMNQAARRLGRVLNCNFSAGDLLLTLTYDSAHLPKDPEGADRECGLFMRRLDRELKKIGVELKYVWITADKDYDKKTDSIKQARLHHHLVVSSFPMDQIRSLEKIWKKGRVLSEPLRLQDDYSSLAAYLVRQAAAEADDKKWHPSRGMEKPVLVEEMIVQKPKELHTPGGANVHEIGPYDSDTGTHYIRYTRKKDSVELNQGDAAQPLSGLWMGG